MHTSIYKYGVRFLQALTFFIVAVVATSCKDDKVDAKRGNKEYDPIADHTLLMYLVADNASISPTLSPSIENNAKDALKAAKDSVKSGSLNLVIFKDNDKSGATLPQLIWIRRNGLMELDTIPLKTYKEEVNAASAEVFKDVIQTTFGHFPDSKIKGLTIGCHALGWTPSVNFTVPAANPDNGEPIANMPSATRAAQFIGIDCSTGEYGTIGYMELWDFSKALKETGLHLDYIIFDACNMANVEVAYELRDEVDYLVAAVTEVMGDGFPYVNVITRLSECNKKEDLLNCLKHCAQLYYNKYRRYSNGATISVLDLQQVEALADTYFELLQESPEREDILRRLNQDKMSALRWQEGMQQFGRSNASSLYCFYDMEQWISHLDSNGDLGSSIVNTMLQDVVKLNLTTSSVVNIAINCNSGMSISLPPLFPAIDKNRGPAYQAAYPLTQWGNKTMEIIYGK